MTFYQPVHNSHRVCPNVLLSGLYLVSEHGENRYQFRRLQCRTPSTDNVVKHFLRLHFSLYFIDNNNNNINNNTNNNHDDDADDGDDDDDDDGDDDNTTTTTTNNNKIKTITTIIINTTYVLSHISVMSSANSRYYIN